MQRILIVHNHYRIPGGEDMVAENEAKLLRDHGHEVYTYERSNNEEAGKLRMAVSMIFSIKTFLEIRRIIREKHIDIVHVHNILHLIGPAVYYAAAAEGVPVVQTMHNFRLLCPAGTFFRKGRVCEECARLGAYCALKHRCYRGSLLQTAVVSASNAIHFRSGIYGKINYICLTEFNKEKLMRLPVGKCFIKPNFTEAGEKAECGGYYLVLGRIERLKGSALIAKAFAKCGRPLIFAGDGEQYGALGRFIERKQLKNIECRGRLPHDEAMELLSHARALIVAPQWYETFGLGVIEAFARGVPVIAADFGNPGSLVRDGVTGVKFKNNVSGLLKALERFEAMDREVLSGNALEEYAEKYSPEANYRRIREIYDSL
ncbi:MAG: glycosyltransferase family 4 protein [Lachnospiraceae bacterium]|nr:glycosyltransferase family 4 protein [Lachnospiraceae bacterium]